MRLATIVSLDKKRAIGILKDEADGNLVEFPLSELAVRSGIDKFLGMKVAYEAEDGAVKLQPLSQPPSQPKPVNISVSRPANQEKAAPEKPSSEGGSGSAALGFLLIAGAAWFIWSNGGIEGALNAVSNFLDPLAGKSIGELTCLDIKSRSQSMNLQNAFGAKISILEISNVKWVSRNSEKLVCEGDALLSTGKARLIMEATKSSEGNTIVFVRSK